MQKLLKNIMTSVCANESCKGLKVMPLILWWTSDDGNKIAKLNSHGDHVETVHENDLKKLLIKYISRMIQKISRIIQTSFQIYWRRKVLFTWWKMENIHAKIAQKHSNTSKCIKVLKHVQSIFCENILLAKVNHNRGIHTRKALFLQDFQNHSPVTI